MSILRFNFSKALELANEINACIANALDERELSESDLIAALSFAIGVRASEVSLDESKPGLFPVLDEVTALVKKASLISLGLPLETEKLKVVNDDATHTQFVWSSQSIIPQDADLEPQPDVEDEATGVIDPHSGPLVFDRLAVLVEGMRIIADSGYSRVTGGQRSEDVYPSDSLVAYAQVTGTAAQELLELYGRLDEWPEVRDQLIRNLDYGYVWAARMPASEKAGEWVQVNPAFNRPEGEAFSLFK